MIRRYTPSLINTKILTLIAALCLLAVSAAVRPTSAQTIGFERERARAMLEALKGDIKKNYYDPNFHGIDLEAHFAKADAALKQATSLRQIVSIIAQTLLDFHDSHTYFVPPARYYQTEYGWEMQIVGDKCFIVAVKPGSDAESKGIKEGDAVISVNGYQPSRDSLWILQYYYYTLSPQQSLQLVVQSPEGKFRQLNVLAKITEGKKLVRGEDYFQLVRDAENEARYSRHRYYELGHDAFVWKMPQFDLSEEEVDQMMGKVKKFKSFILDLRGNGGGYEVTLQRMLGHLFDHDLKIGDLKSRKETKPVMAKTRGANNFKGQLIVLIDSRSASAAELLARIVQLEKRGTVIGDHTAGAVMRARFHEHTSGQEITVQYGASVTESDLLMTDGKSLESVGVTPDTVLLPTAADLAAKRDPILAEAAKLIGLDLDAEKAGKLFPVEWRR